MNSKFNAIKYISKTTVSEWRKDKVPKLAAGLAFYTVFSIPPLLLIVIGIASQFFGEEVARGHLLTQLSGLVGTSVAETIQDVLRNFQLQQDGRSVALVGVVMLLLGAAGVFAELQDSLNQIWEVKPKKYSGLFGFLRKRLLSFGMVLVLGFLLLVSLIITSLITAGLNYTGNSVALVPEAWQIISTLITFVIVTFLFAAMFRFLPDAKIGWRDCWIGAVITAFFFTIGKFFIGLYLGKSATVSAFGAAGSLVLLLLWVYYSAQIFFLGAEVTQTVARAYGSGVILKDGAEYLTPVLPAEKLPATFELNIRMVLDQIRRHFQTRKVLVASALTLLTIFLMVREKQKK